MPRRRGVPHRTDPIPSKGTLAMTDTAGAVDKITEAEEQALARLSQLCAKAAQLDSRRVPIDRESVEIHAGTAQLIAQVGDIERQHRAVEAERASQAEAGVTV